MFSLIKNVNNLCVVPDSMKTLMIPKVEETTTTVTQTVEEQIDDEEED